MQIDHFLLDSKNVLSYFKLQYLLKLLKSRNRIRQFPCIRSKFCETKHTLEEATMRKLTFMLLMVFCFFLGTWHGAAKTNPTNPVVFRYIGGEPFGICDHVVWRFYCRGEPGCNCLLSTEYNIGYGDGPNNCCATCARKSINTQ